MVYIENYVKVGFEQQWQIMKQKPVVWFVVVY